MRIYIHGNCQASAIGWLLGETEAGWTVKSREVHTFDLTSASEFDAYREDVASADVIITQPIWDNYRGVEFLSSKWLSENKSDKAKLLTFPSIHFRGNAIQTFALGIPSYMMDYHDVHVADLYSSGISADQCYAKITSPGFFTESFVLSEILGSLRELTRREEIARTDARVTPAIANYLDQELLFHTFNHPARRILVGVANQLVERFEARVRVPEDGPCYLSNTRIMPYLSAALHAGLPASALPELDLVVREHRVETLHDFVVAFYDSYDQVGREAVRAKLNEHAEAHAYLQRFRSSGQLSSDSLDLRAMVEGMFHNLMKRAAMPREIYYWFNVFRDSGPGEALKQFTSSPEYQDRQR